ncbi:hypothetical protein GUJ93_ZPchr0011g28238 [Zizania palustris]|uniref:Uncharacterized protein n=1 Tax=Zizania palustris TaxID=103762 RepID=A0A8J6BUL7_ZIZPA|nr:hypothetical protein GUJ93_ZPchr0011g28238 [Zizania palustris]
MRHSETLAAAASLALSPAAAPRIVSPASPVREEGARKASVAMEDDEQTERKEEVSEVKSFPHRQVDLMSSGSAVASRVSCSSGNNGIFPPSLLPGFMGFPVVFVNFHLFKAIVRSPASSVVLGICEGQLP